MVRRSAKKSLDKDVIISHLRAHKRYMKNKFGLTKIALFGSYARGEQGKASDIDLLIEMKKHDFDKRCELQEFLEHEFGKKVDVSYFGSVRGFIMEHIKEDIIYA